jgi:PEP-CTERM motif-containing protein
MRRVIMKVLLRGSVVAVALSLAVSAPAQAQDWTVIQPYCNEWVTGTFADCRGAFGFNNAGRYSSAVVDYINSTWGDGFYSAGTTNAGETEGPFETFGNDPTGQLTFSAYGDYVLALKASTTFSLYYFTGGTGLMTVDYSTIGSGVNRWDNAQGLSHATLYRVPEPGLLLLIGTGLLGLAMIRRREDVLV